MCYDQTLSNIYLGTLVSGSYFNVYNISANTLTPISGGPLNHVYNVSLVLRNSVYYIALVGAFTNVGNYMCLYSPSTTSFVDILSQTSGLTLGGGTRGLYTDYYNNLYVGTNTGTRFYCLPAIGTQWFSPAGGFTNGTVYGIAGTGNITAGASSGRVMYIGGNMSSSTSGVTSLGGFARLNVANAITSTFFTNGFSYTTQELLVKGSSSTLLWDSALASWVVTASSNTFIHN